MKLIKKKCSRLRTLSICGSILLLTLTFGLSMEIRRSEATPNVPYTLGNRWTYVAKPGLPFEIGFEEIDVGSEWTYECLLVRDFKYHIYLIGEWTDLTDRDTDYDILVYDEGGNLVSTHTESAGLPEQVSNDELHRYFVTNATALHSFRVLNDPLESLNSRNATFMIMQRLEPNEVYSRYLEGRNPNNQPVLMTSWAYEFNVSSEHFEVFVDVPPTLDMYEARVYPMANLEEDVGEAINKALVPWEPGLYSELIDDLELIDDFGGYNMDNEGYRAPDAFASCEHLGQDMTLTHNNSGNTLYHLALIAEHGAGKVKFYVKTDFDPPILELVNSSNRGYVLEPTPITVSVEDATPLRSIYIKYTTDGEETWSYLNMTHVTENEYSGDVPPLTFGKKVKYSVVAVDEVDNAAEIEGKFSILESRPEPTTITSTLSDQKIKLNKPIEVSGQVVPGDQGIKVTVRFISSATSHWENVETGPGGTYVYSFEPPEVGTWSVLAEVASGDGYDPSQAPLIEFEVAALNPLEKIVVMIVGTLVMMTKPPLQYIVFGAISIVGIFAAYKISGRIRNR